MKVIFLDFDGVLSADSFRFAADFNVLPTNKELTILQNNNDIDLKDLRWINRKHVKFLNKIIAATDAKVVVTSDWRITSSINKLQIILNHCGFNGQVIGKTPSLMAPRGLEIQDWIDNNGPIDSFVIIDDRDDMAHLIDRLVLVNPSKVFQQYLVGKAVQLLK